MKVTRRDQTIGFDDRAWLDQHGNVYSKDMRFEERWRRVGRDTLEAVYRIEDPASYTRPWVSTTKVWKRQAQELREDRRADGRASVQRAREGPGGGRRSFARPDSAE